MGEGGWGHYQKYIGNLTLLGLGSPEIRFLGQNCPFFGIPGFPRENFKFGASSAHIPYLGVNYPFFGCGHPFAILASSFCLQKYLQEEGRDRRQHRKESNCVFGISDIDLGFLISLWEFFVIVD